MTKKYVLTGAPGSGKSSIILSLEQQGESMIREAAEDYIKLRQAQGQKEPWLESDFQDRILELQIQRESKIPKKAKRVYIDRGLPDGLAYATKGTRTYEKIMDASKNVKYDKIFLVELLEETEKTEVRREHHNEAIELGEKLKEIYTMLGYSTISISANPLEKRVNDVGYKSFPD